MFEWRGGAEETRERVSKLIGKPHSTLPLNDSIFHCTTG